MFDIATDEDKKVARSVEACTMFISSIVQEVLAIPHPTIGVEGGKGSLSDGNLTRIILDIGDSPVVMKTLFFDSPCGKSGDNEFSAACAIQVCKKGTSSPMRIKGWAFDDNCDLGFDSAEKLRSFGAQPAVIARYKASGPFNSSDPQEGELWVNVRNIPITALNPVERAEGTPVPANNWDAYGGLRSIYTVLSNSFAYGPQKRRKVKNGYKLFYQHRVSRAGKSSVPRRRHLNVFNKATTINSSC